MNSRTMNKLYRNIKRIYRKAPKRARRKIMILLVLCAFVFFGITFLNSHAVKPEDAIYCTVTEVVDGDTVRVKMKNGEIKKVRMIGVDTPESVHSDSSKNCEEGKIASDYTKSLLTGKNVYLEYDVDIEDNYGRTLAYIYLEDETFVNGLLIEKGYAKTMSIKPNVKYEGLLKQKELKAQLSNIGFWGTGYY